MIRTARRRLVVRIDLVAVYIEVLGAEADHVREVVATQVQHAERVGFLQRDVRSLARRSTAMYSGSKSMPVLVGVRRLLPDVGTPPKPAVATTLRLPHR